MWDPGNSLDMETGVGTSRPNSGVDTDPSVANPPRDQDAWLAKLKLAIENDSGPELDELLVHGVRLQNGVSTLLPARGCGEDPMLTPLLFAAKQGSVNAFDALLKHGLEVASQTTTDDETALHLAARWGRIAIMERLLEIDLDLLDQKASNGNTALLEAINGAQPAAVEYLLRQGADFTVPGRHGRTALFYTRFPNAYPLRKILFTTIFSDDTAEGREKARRFVTMADDFGATVLSEAATSGYIETALHLLSTPAYFPQSPLRDEITRSDDEEAGKVEAILQKWKESAQPDEKQRHQAPVAYWAVVNGRESLLDLAHQITLDRDGASWIHVAAIGGHTHVVKKFSKQQSDLLIPATAGLTPLHLAAAHGHVELIRDMVKVLQEPLPVGNRAIASNTEGQAEENVRHGGILDIMLEPTKQGHTPVDLAVQGATEKHILIEDLLWDEFFKIAAQQADLFHGLADDVRPNAANELLELAARSRPSRRDQRVRQLFQVMVVHRLLPDWRTSSISHLPRSGSNPLHWAIYYQRPTVVWWLLASGAYLGERNVARAMMLNAQIHESISYSERHKIKHNMIIEGLLSDPPPIWNWPPPRDFNPPSFRHMLHKYHYAQGLIMDSSSRTDPTFYPKRPRIWEMIYGKGPRRIMAGTHYQRFATVKRGIQASTESPYGFENSMNEGLSVDEEIGNSKASETWRNCHLRLLHLPMNDDLVVRLCRDKGLTNRDHRPLEDFVQQNSVAVPAGGRKYCMKPQCVVSMLLRPRSPRVAIHSKLLTVCQQKWQQAPTMQQRSKRTLQAKPAAETRGVEMISVHMPYLSWTDRPVGPAELPLGEEAEKQYREMQQPMTLAQYYYVSNEDTTQRDMDQVMGRYIVRQTKGVMGKTGGTRRVSNDTAPSSRQDENTMIDGEAHPEYEAPTKLMTVNQLWVWLLDDGTLSWQLCQSSLVGMENLTSVPIADTIIACTPREPDGDDRGFIDYLVSKLEHQAKGSSVTSKVMARLLIGTAVSLFNEKHIPVLGTLRSPLEIFQASLQYARDLEAHLLNRFETSLGADEADKGGSDTEHTVEREINNGFLRIEAETGFLRELKHICDELNILKNLCEDQEHVWAQAAEVLGNDDHSTHSAKSTPSEVKRQIIGMIREAEAMQRNIESLRDTRQRQANVLEARFARQQAAETARQGDTIVVFTVVTIIFLPLSFLTSLFALNINDFPHKGDDVVYRGGWIFPILFGVSAVVSGFFMTVAFQVNSLKKHIAPVWQHVKGGVRGVALRKR
ncbi:uncharacterized protein DSM5745_08595 [Aspergillus mulundensis]|uniref:Ankyrin repeat protein n=1 Tax=Aspergillus mulundensis TaxID=1810919 RepID=A0A3D8R449_9EURO|nr:hypothetical protein DSM5745_08595 [Aspergillus mulundensis]RDW68835.1 hypothetical protein DSM5745_08595 [Aspergillus mulundensis]